MAFYYGDQTHKSNAKAFAVTTAKEDDSALFPVHLLRRLPDISFPNPVMMLASTTDNLKVCAFRMFWQMERELTSQLPGICPQPKESWLSRTMRSGG